MQNLQLKIEQTLTQMGCTKLDPVEVTRYWEEHPPYEAEPWEMRVRLAIDALVEKPAEEQHKRTKHRAVVKYKPAPGEPERTLVVR